MSLRHLVERPFRHYGDFSGRSGRAEYWLLILMFIVVTEIAWLVGFGGMRLAGYQADDRSGTLHYMYENSLNHYILNKIHLLQYHSMLLQCHTLKHNKYIITNMIMENFEQSRMLNDYRDTTIHYSHYHY